MSTGPLYSCHPCRKSFSGIIPYKQHKESSLHEKKMELLEQFPNYGDPPTTHSFTYCDTCGKSFSGPVPYYQHLASQFHEKRVQKNIKIDKIKAVKESQLDSSNECMLATPKAKKYCLKNELVNTKMSATEDDGDFHSNLEALLSPVPSNSIYNELDKLLRAEDENEMEDPKQASALFDQDQIFSHHSASNDSDRAVKSNNDRKDPLPRTARYGEVPSSGYRSASESPKVSPVDDKLVGCTICSVKNFNSQKELAAHLTSFPHAKAIMLKELFAKHKLDGELSWQRFSNRQILALIKEM